MKNLQKMSMRPNPLAGVGIILLLFAIGFNLWIYRMEPTALTDPNDNTFQYALVDRTNQIWDYATKTCSGIQKPFCILSYLTDHWVPNWAEGYNLPYYYSHIPQIAIVASYRLLHSLFRIPYSLFTYYHIIIYLLLCLFPLSVFFSLRIIRISPIVSGIGALLASHLSTNGLYGLDPSSFLWRGYGLSSQLFAMVWLPFALSYAYQCIQSDDHRTYQIPAILFLTATTAGHLGIGIIAFLSIGVIYLSHVPHLSDLSDVLKISKKLLFLYGSVFLLLGYWIFPILRDSAYHNISVWDGIWKFDSFGYREVLTHLINGDVFDYGRFPIVTILVFIGLFSALFTIHYSPFTYLFLFWLLMYFGRTTWGGVFNLIPGMSEYHLSRFIVGVHIAGIFLIPIGLELLVSRITYHVSRLAVTLSLCIFVTLLVVPQSLRYASHNDFLITRSNQNYTTVHSDTELLLAKLRSYEATSPGRVFAGRGGSWGKNFRVAETPMYMHLSTYGIPVILWLPETWSPNSDTEQYFSEGNPDHYSLYNVRYVVTPKDLAKNLIQPFWKLVETKEKWNMYEVQTDGYITPGVRPAIVRSDKEHFRSVVRLWLHSDYPKQGLYPELTFDPNYPKTSGLPNFRMLDEANYVVPDKTLHNLFSENPRYVRPSSPAETSVNEGISITSQSSDSDMVFSATVDVPADCIECIIVLKQTFHPSWHVTVDGTPVQPFAVFPFFTAVKVETPGNHEIIFTYRPSIFKQVLLVVAIFTLGSLPLLLKRFSYDKSQS